MRLRPCLNQRLSVSEFRAQTCSVITHDWECAAFFSAIQREGGDDGVAGWLQGLSQSRDMACAVGRHGEKMKGGPVVPEVKGPRRAPVRGAGGDPCDVPRLRTQTRPRGLQRGLRQVQNLEVVITALEAIYLADKIVLMTNGPGAMFAEIVENPLPLERRRDEIHRHPDYYPLRNHLIDFLVTRSITFKTDIPAGYDRKKPPVVRLGAKQPALA